MKIKKTYKEKKTMMRSREKKQFNDKQKLTKGVNNKERVIK